MSVNRSNPQDDEARRLTKAQQQIETQKVGRVEEADADARAKKRFNAYMQPEEDENAGVSEAQSSPSPYQVSSSYNAKGAPDSGISTSSAIPSPSYAPPPNVNEVPVSSFDDLQEDTLSADDLPQGFEFYQNSDLSDPYGASTPPPEFNEDTSQTNSKGPANKLSDRVDPVGKRVGNEMIADKKSNNQVPQGAPFISQKVNKLEPSPFGSPGKVMAPKLPPGSNTHKPGVKVPEQKKKPEEDLDGTGRFWVPEEKIQTPPPSTLASKNEPERKITGTTRSDALTDRAKDRKAEVKPFQPVSDRIEKDLPQQETKTEKKPAAKKDTPDFITPSLTTLPAQVQPAAEAAATAAAPYLSADVRAQYYQMIGTIYVMQENKGVSKTEFLLNHPSFANSKFFGAKIEVTRYSTAPDAFNIRLTGTTEAVNAFKESIPSLQEAFQAGNHKFQINRIEAQYSSERPVFHRKDSDRGEKGEK